MQRYDTPMHLHPQYIHAPAHPCAATSNALTQVQPCTAATCKANAPVHSCTQCPRPCRPHAGPHLHAEPALLGPEQAIGDDAARRTHPQAPALGQPGLRAQQEGAGDVPPQQRDAAVPGEGTRRRVGAGRAGGMAAGRDPLCAHLAMPAKAQTLSARTLSFSGRKAKLLAPLLSHPTAAARAH